MRFEYFELRRNGALDSCLTIDGSERIFIAVHFRTHYDRHRRDWRGMANERTVAMLTLSIDNLTTSKVRTRAMRRAFRRSQGAGSETAIRVTFHAPKDGEAYERTYGPGEAGGWMRVGKDGGR